jgi:hypothetical protein
MRNLILASIVIVVAGITSISSLMGTLQASQLDTNLVVNQEEQAPPVPEPEAAAPIQETQPSVSDAPVIETPMPEGQSVMQEPMIIQPGEMPVESIVMPETIAMPASCQTCGCQPCCCPQCPVSTTFTLVDPCTCCSYEICVTVPPCCVNIAPNVNWRGGIFGRRVAELCWPCCDKEVKVVVTKHGKVRVRG